MVSGVGCPGDDVLVFYVPKNLCRVLKKDLAYAGIPYKGWGGYLDVHSLRHTVGTRLVNDPRVPTKTAQSRMRHSDQRLTTETYMDKRYIDLRVGLDALPSLPLRPTKAEPESGVLRATGTDDQSIGIPEPPLFCEAQCEAPSLPGKGSSVTSAGTESTQRAGKSANPAKHVSSAGRAPLASAGTALAPLGNPRKDDYPQGDSNPCRQDENLVS